MEETAPVAAAPAAVAPAAEAPASMGNGGTLTISGNEILKVVMGGLITGFTIGIGFILAQKVMGKLGKSTGDLNDATSQSVPSPESSEFAGGYKVPVNSPQQNFMPHPQMRASNAMGRDYSSNPNAMTGGFMPYTGNNKKASPYENFDFTTGSSW